MFLVDLSPFYVVLRERAKQTNGSAGSQTATGGTGCDGQYAATIVAMGPGPAPKEHLVFLVIQDRAEDDHLRGGRRPDQTEGSVDLVLRAKCPVDLSNGTRPVHERRLSAMHRGVDAHAKRTQVAGDPGRGVWELHAPSTVPVEADGGGGGLEGHGLLAGLENGPGAKGLAAGPRIGSPAPT